MSAPVQHNGARFRTGQLVATRGVVALGLGDDALRGAIHRHVTGQWSNLDPDDREANEAAILHNERILSVDYLGGRKVWLITEADRSVTTILLPDEY